MDTNTKNHRRPVVKITRSLFYNFVSGCNHKIIKGMIFKINHKLVKYFPFSANEAAWDDYKSKIPMTININQLQ